MVNVEFELGQYNTLDEMLPVIWDVEYMAGVTNTADGISTMQDMFKR